MGQLWGFQGPAVQAHHQREPVYGLMDSLEDHDGLVATPKPPAPKGVHWDHEAVVLVAMGEFEEFDCSVEIREVRRIGYRALCDVSVDILPPLRFQALTSPYYIGKIDRR